MEHRPYTVICNRPLDGLDYKAAFPFSAWQSKHLTTLIGGWLQFDPPCLELATLALTELARRRDDLEARMKFSRAALEPVAWLADARAAISGTLLPAISNTSSAKSRRGTLYVILRGGYTLKNQWYGAYVGSTVKTVEARFLEHRKGGQRAARGLPVHGIEPLYSLFLPLKIPARTRAELREWETRLHECLAPHIPKVTGDVAF